MLWILSFPLMYDNEKPFRLDQLCGVLELLKISNKFSNEQLTKIIESVLEVISFHGTYEQTFNILDLIKKMGVR